jgi:Ran GTPase-activating protein 1
VSSIGEVQINH